MIGSVKDQGDGWKRGPNALASLPGALTYQERTDSLLTECGGSIPSHSNEGRGG